MSQAARLDLQTWLEEKSARGRLVDLDELLGRMGRGMAPIGGDLRAALIQCTESLATMGFGIEPDLRFNYPVLFDGKSLVLFRTAIYTPQLPDLTFSSLLTVLDVGLVSARKRRIDTAVSISAIDDVLSGADWPLKAFEIDRIAARIRFLLQTSAPVHPALERHTEATPRTTLAQAVAGGDLSIRLLYLIECIFQALKAPISSCFLTSATIIIRQKAE